MWARPAVLLLGFALAWTAACAEKKQERASSMNTPASQPAVPATGLATFGAGCFWCVEAVFEELAGVISAESGYEGGAVENPTYPQVCEGTTGHAEVCLIRFDPGKVSYERLLEVFWRTHDPTTLNRQGQDVGTQYRSVIFTHDERQKALAEEYKRKLDASGAFARPIVTQVVPAARFYPAEAYHQDYFRLNPEKGYCRAIIAPKIDKFRGVFQGSLKKGR